MPLTAFERLKINFFKRLEVTVMSKNQEERANYYLYIDGQAVPVSEEIYRVYQHYERKEEYFSYDLNRKKPHLSCPAERIPMNGCWKRTGSLLHLVSPWRKWWFRLSGWKKF